MNTRTQKIKIPLFFWLHGAGERGDDNESTHPYCTLSGVRYGAVKISKHRLAPQCPKDEYWAPVKRFEWSIINGGAVTPPMERLIKLLEQILKDPKIDKNRIYLGGLSMGGFGTYEFIVSETGMVCCGSTHCGGADLDKAKIIRIFHFGFFMVPKIL
ncbi:MAG: hypothetical protein IPN46_18365 [Saprospiraceae bacterium]|nr:hypothetical protein [Saprospiraceae bacterium]